MVAEDEKMQDVLAVVVQLGESGAVFQLCFGYQGLILTRGASLVEAHHRMAVFRSQQELPMLEANRGVCLHHAELPQNISARVESFWAQRRLVRLSGLAWTGSPWRERALERVRPGQPLAARLNLDPVLDGTVQDVSPHGLGLLVSCLDRRRPLEWMGRSALVQLRLPGMPLMRLRGEVMSVHAYSAHLIRVGLRLYPGREQERRLGGFVEGRRRAILHELSSVHPLFQPPGESYRLFF